MTRFFRTRISRTIVATAMGLLFAGAAMADSLELKDGRVLDRQIPGRDASIDALLSERRSADV